MHSLSFNAPTHDAGGMVNNHPAFGASMGRWNGRRLVSAALRKVGTTLATIAASLWLATPAYAQVATPAGTMIENSARISFTDANGATATIDSERSESERGPAAVAICAHDSARCRRELCDGEYGGPNAVHERRRHGDAARAETDGRNSRRSVAADRAGERRQPARRRSGVRENRRCRSEHRRRRAGRRASEAHDPDGRCGDVAAPRERSRHRCVRGLHPDACERADGRQLRA